MQQIVLSTFIKKTIISSLFFVVVIGVIPLLHSPSAAFLGRDMTNIATGIISFYPLIAVKEALKVLAFNWCLVSIMVAPWLGIVNRSQGILVRLILFPGMPLFCYLLLMLGSLLYYPALFESYLNPTIKVSIYRLSFWTDPYWFWYASALQFLIGWILFVLGSFKRATIIACVVLVFVLVWGINLFRIGIPRNFPQEASSTYSAFSQKPNILLIAIDSLRSDRVNQVPVMPSLVKLASDPQSVQFTDHHVGVPRTFPSWIELITSQNAPKTGVRHMFPGFAVRKKRFSGFVSSLREVGYETYLWSDFAGDIFPRFEAGFKHVIAPNMNIPTMIRMSVDQAIPTLLGMMVVPLWHDLFPDLKQSPAFADAHHLGTKVLETLPEASRPFLGVVFYSSAHFPYASPFPYYRKFGSDRYSGPYFFQKNPELGKSSEDSVSEEDIQQIRALYDGALRSIDDSLGVIFAELKNRGLWDSTFIIVTADHGEELFDHGFLQGHGEHLRGDHVLKVPLIFKLPLGMRPVVHRIDQLTRSIDVGTTILDVAGFPSKNGDGVSLVPAWNGGAKKLPIEEAYSETGLWFSRGGGGFYQSNRLDYPGISGMLVFDQGYSGEIVLDQRFEKIVVAAKHRSLVAGRYKLIYMPTEKGVRFELFDRYQDPGNTRNLADVEPSLLDGMKERFFSKISELEPDLLLMSDFVVPR